jgi:Ti-type conjugative transfer relaxase TraA
VADFRCSFQMIKRSEGRSVVAAAAYRAGERLYDERLDKYHDFSHKSDVIFSTLLLATGAPESYHNREIFWNAVEAVEKRENSQLSREVQLSLPNELTLEQRKQLTLEFVQTQFVDRGMCADIAIHASKDGNNPHAHILLTTRAVDAQGFTHKNRDWNQKSFLLSIRKEWAVLQNAYLARAGFDVRVDHRSYQDQGIGLEPTTKQYSPTDTRFVAQDSRARSKIIRANNGQRLLDNPEQALYCLTRKQSSFTQSDLEQFVTTHTASDEQKAAVLQAIDGSPCLLDLGLDRKGERRFTSTELLSKEIALLHHAEHLSQAKTHGVSSALQQQIAQQFQLQPEQQQVFKAATDGNGIVCIRGLPGTGKSHVSAALCAAYEQMEYQVQGVALAGKMVDAMGAEAKITAAKTIVSQLTQWHQGDGLPTAKHVLIVDEAGMVGTRQLERLLGTYQKAGGKVILLGDEAQFQPIDAGAAFRGVVERVGSVRLQKVQRQQAQWQQQASVDFGSQQLDKALRAYDKQGCLHAHDDSSQAIGAVVDAYQQLKSAYPEQRMSMLASRNVDVAVLNNEYRSRLFQAGALGDESLFKVCRKEENPVSLDGEMVVMEEHKGFAVGDRIVLGHNDYDLGVKNGELGTITGIHGYGRYLSIDRDHNSALTIDTQQYRYFDYGYALTGHKLQGETLDHTVVFLNKATDRFGANVAFTRHRASLSVHYSGQTFKDTKSIIRHLNRTEDKSLLYEEIEAARRRHCHQADQPVSLGRFSREEEQTIYQHTLQSLKEGEQRLRDIVNTREKKIYQEKEDTIAKRMEEHRANEPQKPRLFHHILPGRQALYERNMALWEKEDRNLRRDMVELEEGKGRALWGNREFTFSKEHRDDYSVISNAYKATSNALMKQYQWSTETFALEEKEAGQEREQNDPNIDYERYEYFTKQLAKKRARKRSHDHELGR